MGKKNPERVIEPGTKYTVETDSRADAVSELNELRKQAQELGLAHSGGFIEHKDGKFFANITFVKQ